MTPVLLVCDEGPGAGLGHRRRCEAIATALRAQGIAAAVVPSGAGVFAAPSGTSRGNPNDSGATNRASTPAPPNPGYTQRELDLMREVKGLEDVTRTMQQRMADEDSVMREVTRAAEMASSREQLCRQEIEELRRHLQFAIDQRRVDREWYDKSVEEREAQLAREREMDIS